MPKSITLSHDSVSPQSSNSGRTLEECLSILLTEIELAFTWDRPTILLTLRQSKNGLDKAMAALKAQLNKTQKEVIDIHPPFDKNNILEMILNSANAKEHVFFVRGLGEQKEVYAGLNFYREHIVEQRLKIVFWLVEDEIFELSRLAPDFWSFRHRVVEFSNKGSRGTKLPSGVLLWDSIEPSFENDTINEQIILKKEMLGKLPITKEALLTHADLVYNLAHLYWIRGENQVSTDLLHQELTLLDTLQLQDMNSLLLNGLAINYYDQEKFKEALHLTETALRFMPNSSIIQANHGIICRAAGNSKHAMPWVKKALRINSDAPHLWGILGFLFISMGKYKSALESFENALSLTSNNLRYYVVIAVCHSKIGNSDLFKKTMQLISNNMNDNNIYHEICKDGLSGNHPSALSRLKAAIHEGKILSSFTRRDPVLNLIFSPEKIETVLQNG